MANQQAIERIAAAVNALRPEWPVASLVTMLTEKHQHRDARTLALAATWVATDRDTQTPGLLNTAAPWRAVSTLSDAEKHPSDEYRARWVERQRKRLEGAKHCGRCDQEGMLPSGGFCDHRSPEAIRAEREAAAQMKARVLATVLQLKAHTPTDSDDNPPDTAA